MNTPTNRVSVVTTISLIYCITIIFVLNKSSNLSYQAENSESSTSFQNNLTSVFPSSPDFLNEISKSFIQTEKVVIGLVSCRTGSAKGNRYYDQTFTLIKSLLISCKLFNIAAAEIHLFLEHVKDEQYFRDEINRKLYFPENETQIQLTLQVHSAVDAVPKKYRDHMVFHPRFRCGYVRFFYPVSKLAFS